MAVDAIKGKAAGRQPTGASGTRARERMVPFCMGSMIPLNVRLALREVVKEKRRP